MLFVYFHAMPIVRMHMESADGLVDEYRNAAGNVRDILADLSPYVTDAYELLGRGGNPAYGPRAALQTLVNDLGVEREDVAWRCLLYTSPSPRDATLSRMPSSA